MRRAGDKIKTLDIGTPTGSGIEVYAYLGADEVIVVAKGGSAGRVDLRLNTYSAGKLSRGIARALQYATPKKKSVFQTLRAFWGSDDNL